MGSKMRQKEINGHVDEYPDISGKTITCRYVMQKVLPTMQKISKERKSEEEWLKLLYQYCVSEYFPENFLVISNKNIRKACKYYLEILNEEIKKEQENRAFDRCCDFEFLTWEEKENCGIKEEYEHFQSIIKNLSVCEFMWIAREITPFNTLGHIAGVHFVAMYIARQIYYNTSIKIDIGLVSAAAFIHDIGKFGCKEEESGRVPYLHYYYTQQFAHRYDMELIGHIAANHSTWDLELENLSIENLILIYADFRVKSIRKEGREIICFKSLDKSYDVILNKLDNVDAQKKNRYKKVFQKLKDFEKFLWSMGIATDLETGYAGIPVEKQTEFLNVREAGEKIRYRAIRSNIMVMNTINNFSAFVGLIEEAKGEKDWRNIRAYLNVLEEYSTYMTCRQKRMVLSFLYEMLMNKDGDIRRQSARIMGQIIAKYEIKYQKEIPEGASHFNNKQDSFLEIWDRTLHSMLIVDHKITQQHRRWIGYAMKNVFLTVVKEVEEENQQQILQVLIKFYEYSKWDALSRFILMDCASEIKFSECTVKEKNILEKFTMESLKESDRELHMAALRFLFIWTGQGWRADKQNRIYLEEWMEENKNLSAGFQYLMAGIGKRLFEKRAIVTRFRLNQQDVSVLFMENQKVDTPWIYKLVNMEMLNMYYRQNNRKQSFQWAAHLANILQTSDRIVIRRRAGKYLTDLIPKLSYEQRYEIATELVKGLEIGEYSVSKYIPEYLGKIFFKLDDDMQEEFLEKFQKMIDGQNHKVAIVTLETVGTAMQYVYIFKKYVAIESRLKRKEQMEGLLFRGMAHYIDEISQEAFYIVGHSIFGSKVLTLEEKAEYFYSMSKKILTLMRVDKKIFYLYNNAAALNHIYRFLSNYYMKHGELMEMKEDKVAFFPGTFDPFSRGHKEVVKEIQKQGFTVFLALDEFSWSKRTQPYKIRRKLMEMSVADLKNVYIFPAEIPINIANPLNLKKLYDIFKEQKLYIAVGSDVVDNASAYRMKKQEFSIHNFNHIILQRNTRKHIDKNKVAEKISGKILYLDILERGENISSTRIRDNLDLNRDISNLIETNAQNYIYEQGLYIREPGYRLVTNRKAIHTTILEKVTEEIEKELSFCFFKDKKEDLEREKIIFIRDADYYNQITGCILFHPSLLSDLYAETGKEETALYLRRKISGKIAVLSSISTKRAKDYEESKQIVFS